MKSAIFEAFVAVKGSFAFMCCLMQQLFNMCKFNLKVLYYDNDLSAEPLTFRDVFLRSQALEGVTLSMVS